MSALFDDVARASLPVAIALLAFTATARAGLWADPAPVQRLARQYVEPLSTWCLGAAAVNLFAVVAAGDAGVLSLLLPIAVGAGAVLLRPSAERTPVPAAAPRQPAAAPAPPAEPAPATGSLWAKRAEEGPTREGSLWSR